MGELLESIIAFCIRVARVALEALRTWKRNFNNEVQPSGMAPVQYLAKQFDFKAAARRHHNDAELLTNEGRGANAGQLYGFATECGLKALMVAHGLPTEPNGDIRFRPYRTHVPALSQTVATITVFPDGRAATRYISMLPDLAYFDDWKVDHRYWMESAIPSASLPNWRTAAL